jgi:hypothetical protein
MEFEMPTNWIDWVIRGVFIGLLAFVVLALLLTTLAQTT